MIIFDQVTKQFAPDSYGVHDVSFQIEPGEFVLLTGKSGAGKTTLMRLLTKEYTPTEGTIVFEDADLNDISYGSVHLLRRKIGVVFQDYRLLPELNVWENIALPLSIVGQPQSEIEERVTDLLRLIGLADKAALFPSQLSGGEAQRVSIARALANGPSVIFADEPTGNLDKETSESIGRLLKKINELGTTILFATHDQSVLDLFKDDRLLHMEQGKLVKDSRTPQHKPKHAHKTAKAAEQPSTPSEAAPQHNSPPAAPEKTTKPSPGPLGGFFGLFGKRKPVGDADRDDAPKKIKVQVKTESLDE